MKTRVVPEIQKAARSDFSKVQEYLKSSNITASLDSIRFSKVNNVVTATCDFKSETSKDIIAASIRYQTEPDGIYADSDVDEVYEAILASVGLGSTVITAAEDDEDEGFVFDEFEDDTETTDEGSNDEDEVVEDEDLDDESEFEDPEEEPSIETDNNIEGHYIAECNRCHGIFISALVESDQHVEFLSGICPLCEKESDQYIKWVIKSVE